MSAASVRRTITDLLRLLPDSELPKWTERDGAIWFDNLGKGWISSTAPERMTRHAVDDLFAAEAASRELLRRADGAA